MTHDDIEPALAPPELGQFLVYQAEDGKLKLDVRLQGETVWLTQQHMAELFQTSKQNISQHLKNIFAEGELSEDAVVKIFFTTASDGKKYRTSFYSLDAIISVGYRVTSHTATRFRIWATQKLREFIVKGFVMDDERLKNPDQPFDYFEELLRRIQDIRTSERRFYQKITDIYATSLDYDPTQDVSIQFFQTVQNKLHWAITGHTAAEIIRERANAEQPNMGLTSWRGPKVRGGGRQHREKLSVRGRIGCAEQSSRTVPAVRRGPGDAPHSHVHARLDRQAACLLDAEQP